MGNNIKEAFQNNSTTTTTKTKEEQEKMLPLTALPRQLDKQSIQISKVIQMLQPVQRQIKPAEKQTC